MTAVRSYRLVVLRAAAAVGIVAGGLSACGGAAPSSVARIATTVPSTATVPAGSATPAGSVTSTEPGASPGTTSPSGPQGGQAGAGDIASQLLAFAECMRSNGVPTFPDPSAGGGFQVPAGTDTSSPAYEAAEAKCQKLLPAGPGSGPPPSSQALANMVKVAQCMRRHGISEFPDPRTSVPSRILPTGHSGIQEISDIDGVILVFPTTIDMQSPAFTQVAAACRFPLHNH